MKYLHIGKLGKSFGLKHQIRMSLFAGMEHVWETILAENTAIFIGIQDFKIPFFIEQFDPSKQLVKFDKVSSEAEMKELMGQEIYIEHTTDIDNQYFDVQTFESLELFDFETKKIIGVIDRVEEFPSQMMAIVKRGNDEIMIPLVESWIKEFDTDAKQVYMDLPEGMISDE